MPKILNIPIKYRSKEWLYIQYINNHLCSRKIADIVGCDRKTIDNWLHNNNIKKRGFGGSNGRQSKDWLYKEYIEQNKSLNIISKEIGEDRKTIHRWLMGYNIIRHKVGGRTGKDSNFWRDGEHKYTSKSKGYIFVYQPIHYVREHKLIAEKYLERKLRKGEIIHHIDFNRSNNDVNNLYLFPNQSKHMKYHSDLKLGKVGTLKSNLIE